MADHVWPQRTRIMIDKTYDAAQVEPRIANLWDEAGASRAGAGARPVEVLRLVAAATLTGARVTVSADAAACLPSSIGHVQVVTEDDAACLVRARRTADVRVRAIGEVPPTLVDDLVAGGVDVITGEVLATGRRELLPFVLEQAVSTTRHRFGHVAKS